MAENEFCDGPIYVSRVEHACKRMAALMRRVAHPKVTHDGVKDCPSERVVAVPATVSAAADVEPWRLHSLLVPRQELARNWDEPASAGIGLAVTNHNNATSQLDVSLADMTVLANTTARVDEHEHMARLGHLIDATPQFIPLSDSKGHLLVHLLRPVNIEISRVVFYDEVVPQGILVELLEQGADFLLRRVSAATAAHVINDLVKVAKPDVYENHRMEAGAMLIRVTVADACGFASEPWKVLSLPERVHLSEGRLARAQQGRVAIVLDQVRHRILECLEVPQGFLSVLDSLLDDIRPPPVALQAVDGSKSVW